MADPIKIVVNASNPEKIVVNQGPITIQGGSNYTLPAATNTTLGGVIIPDGGNLAIDSGGNLTFTGGGNYVPIANLTGTGWNGKVFVGGVFGDPTANLVSGVNSDRGLKQFITSYRDGANITQFWVDKDKARIYGSPTGATIDSALIEVSRQGGIALATGNNQDATLVKQGTQTWSDYSILTRGYADSRYLLTSNFTYANLTGTPNLATVATSGLYSDLTGTPDLTDYLTTATAAATYQPISGMSSYLTTSTAASTYTPLTRTIAAGTGLSGGGDLSANRTLSLAASGVAAGQYGSGSVIPKITIDIYGRITAVVNDTIYPDWNNISSKPIDSSTGTAVFSMAANLADNELIRAKLKDYSETRATPAISAGSLTLNLETANFFAVSLNASVSNAIAISNPPASGSVGSFTLELTADGTARTINWGTIKWPAGTAPTLTSASGKRDIFVFYTTDAGANWYGLVGGQNL